MRRPSALALATIGAVPILIALCVLDVVNTPVTAWFARHAFTTSAVVSVLVLLITVLNVDRIARRRQEHDRARVTAAQAAILARQAQRTVDAVQTAAGEDSQRENAGDELRTYLSMLLVSAPVLIEAAPARTFLESAQRLGGLLSYAVAHADDDAVADRGPRLQQAATQVSRDAQPLLAILNLAQRQAVESDED